MNSLGQTLYLWRQAKGLTQAELARRAEVSRPNLCRIEQGGSDVTLRTLKRLAKVLGLRAGFLVDGIVPEPFPLKTLSRERLDRIARFLIGEKVRLSPEERNVAQSFRMIAKRKLGLAEGRGRNLPRTARAEQYHWLLTRIQLRPSEAQNLLSRIDKLLSRRR